MRGLLLFSCTGIAVPPIRISKMSHAVFLWLLTQKAMKSLIEELPKIVEEGKKEAEKILERLSSVNKLALQTNEKHKFLFLVCSTFAYCPTAQRQTLKYSTVNANRN